MELNIDATGLPAYAYARSPYTGGIVRIVRGERALFGVNNQTCVDELNAAAGVTRRPGRRHVQRRHVRLGYALL